MPTPVVLHIPHASVVIPDDVRRTLLPAEAELAAEMLRMTDWHTDELFGGLFPGAAEVVYPVSRLVVDPERFEDDALEPAAAHGMGVIYVRTSQGAPLRATPSPAERETLLERFYRPHHRRLTEAVERRLAEAGTCLVVDCHSFPRLPVPFQVSPARPDICIGTDRFHTPDALRDTTVATFEAEGLSVLVNDPFAGALVPTRHYGRDRRVTALMIEIGRWLYMDERTGEQHGDFETARRMLRRAAGIWASGK